MSSSWTPSDCSNRYCAWSMVTASAWVISAIFTMIGLQCTQHRLWEWSNLYWQGNGECKGNVRHDFTDKNPPTTIIWLHFRPVQCTLEIDRVKLAEEKRIYILVVTWISYKDCVMIAKDVPWLLCIPRYDWFLSVWLFYLLVNIW